MWVTFVTGQHLLKTRFMEALPKIFENFDHECSLTALESKWTSEDTMKTLPERGNWIALNGISS